MRCYYNDPLEAAWMAKYFCMRFLDCANYFASDEFDHNDAPYYIHENSLHLLEPQVGDFIHGLYKVGTLGTLIGQEILDGNEESAKMFISKGVKIILRKGIPFHWPKVES